MSDSPVEFLSKLSCDVRSLWIIDIFMFRTALAVFTIVYSFALSLQILHIHVVYFSFHQGGQSGTQVSYSITQQRQLPVLSRSIILTGHGRRTPALFLDIILQLLMDD